MVTHPNAPDDPGCRVLIVDDHPVFRRGLRDILDGEPWVREVHEASTAGEAEREAVFTAFDLVVMDIELPDHDGLIATRRIVRNSPRARILVLTMTEDQKVVIEALNSGASGYILKKSDPRDIVHALQTVLGGGLVLGPSVSTASLRALRAQDPHLDPPLDRLTLRERQILGLIAQGRTNSFIGRQLNVSEKTVRNQVSIIFTKLNVTDRLQAALLAREAGLQGPLTG
jgi:DNA-binding NarL/FixJ family response regulator